MKISIIIPSVGRKTLPGVISEIEKCEGFAAIKPEVIVVFNGNPDKVPKLPKWVKFYSCSEKVWAGQARNIGIEKSKGDIITFLGDDTFPDVQWLERIVEFFNTHEEFDHALVGMIGWEEYLRDDPFYKWLLNHAQFAFRQAKRDPNWHHFYTANISVTRKLIGDDRFDDRFEGWGFEDTEFGYRLFLKGMRLHFDKKCQVYHDHVMTLEEVLKRTRSSRHNAMLFEELHPEIHIFPTPVKKLILQVVIWLSWPFALFIPQVRWWREWKKAWLGV